MTFIQTISFSTSRMDEMQKKMDRWDEEHGGRRVRLVRDRDGNSNRPETDAFAKQMGELTDGPPNYGNYDVVAEQ